LDEAAGTTSPLWKLHVALQRMVPTMRLREMPMRSSLRKMLSGICRRGGKDQRSRCLAGLGSLAVGYVDGLIAAAVLSLAGAMAAAL
jgi:hypothetical protein